MLLDIPDNRCKRGHHGYGSVRVVRGPATGARPFVALMDRHLPDWRRYRRMLNAEPLAHEAWGR
jgi:hypothetical protein